MRTLSTVAWSTALLVSACALDGVDGLPETLAPLGVTVSAQTAADGPSFVFDRRGEVFDARLGTTPVAFPARERVILLGGAASGIVRSDTLEWDGFGWQRRVTTGLPGPRFAAVSAFDARRGRVLLFGGFGATSPSLAVTTDSSLWEWNGSDWAVLAAENPPPPCGGGAGAVHGRTGDLWMFGGTQATDAGGVDSTDELYRFDGRAWTKIEKPAGGAWPPARALATMAFEPNSGKIILFGGFGTFNAAPNGYPSVSEPLADTWEWDGERWAERPSSERPLVEVYGVDGTPVPLSGRQTLVERDGELLLVHEALNGIELWSYDTTLASWKKRWSPTSADVGPAFRLMSSAFVDPRSNDIVVFGGLRTSVPLGSTKEELLAAALRGEPVGEYFRGDLSTESWRYNGERWTRVAASADPGPREGAAAAYDEARGNAVMFGGAFSSSVKLDDTWMWNGGQWTRLSPSGARPAARFRHVMAYHPGMGKVVLFGGINAAGAALSDTWTWDGQAWQQLSPATSPPARGETLLLRRDNDVVLYGGRGATDADGTRDLWRLTADGQWQQITGLALLSSAYAACGTGEAGLGVYLFGGMMSATDNVDDLAYLNGDTWEKVEPTSTFTPEDRRLCALFGDVHRRQLVLGDGLGGAVDTTWNRYLIDTGEWLSITPRPYDRLADPPRRSHGTTYFYDHTANAVTFYGGRANDIDVVGSETWRLRQVGDTCGGDGSCAPGTYCVDGVCCESKACGACESCAMPGNRGVCTARGVVESVPGCSEDEGLACSTSGRCRAANGSSCNDDAQCASNTCVGNTCCSAEGCTQMCVDDLWQRNPNGSLTSCGSYVCRGSACLESCSTVLDCSPDNVCNSEGKCVGANEESGQRPSSCAIGVSSGGPPLLLAALLLLGARRRKERV